MIGVASMLCGIVVPVFQLQGITVEDGIGVLTNPVAEEGDLYAIGDFMLFRQMQMSVNIVLDFRMLGGVADSEVD